MLNCDFLMLAMADWGPCRQLPPSVVNHCLKGQGNAGTGSCTLLCVSRALFTFPVSVAVMLVC